MQHSASQRYLFVWITLLCLLTVTGIAAYTNLGWGNTVISMAIAAVKAVLIAVFFMQILKGDAALRLTIILPLLLFFLLFFLGFADYSARNLHPMSARPPVDVSHLSLSVGQILR